jgi:hypothetical protein
MPSYVAEFGSYASALNSDAGLPAKAIQGLTFCCSRSAFDEGMDGYAALYAQSLGSLSYVSFARWGGGWGDRFAARAR